jgi:hypothetical protein
MVEEQPNKIFIDSNYFCSLQFNQTVKSELP